MQGLHDVRDRTAEFFSTVAALQKQHVIPASSSIAATSNSPNRLFTNAVLPRSASSTFPSSTPLTQQHDDHKDTAPLLGAAPSESAFNRAERGISSHLSLLSEQLSRLSRLVQKKSLFDDPTAEIEELVHVVKEGLERVEAEVGGLERIVKSEGKEEKEGGGGGRHRETHSKVVVDNLRNNLKKKMVEFMDVLQTRTKVSQQLTTARTCYTPQVVFAFCHSVSPDDSSLMHVLLCLARDEQNMKEQNTRRKQFETNSSLPVQRRGGQSSSRELHKPMHKVNLSSLTPTHAPVPFATVSQ